MNSIVLVFYYCIGKKQHILASLRKAEQNIFVPPGLARGFLKSFHNKRNGEMNSTFKIVFNRARGAMTVVNEMTKSHQTGRKAAVAVAVAGALAFSAGVQASEYVEAQGQDKTVTQADVEKGGKRVVGGWRNWSDTAQQAKLNNTVTVESGEWQLVIGGHYSGVADKAITHSVENTNVVINGGSITKSVVGGTGASDNLEVTRINKNAVASVTINGGSFGVAGEVGNTTELFVLGGDLMKHRGGFKNDPKDPDLSDAYAESEIGATHVTIKDGTFNSAIVGGSAAIVYYGNANKGAKTTVGTTNVTIEGGTFNHAIVAGGLASGHKTHSFVTEANLSVIAKDKALVVNDSIFAGGVRRMDSLGGSGGSVKVDHATVRVEGVKVEGGIYGTHAALTGTQSTTNSNNISKWHYDPLEIDGAVATVLTDMTLVNVSAKESILGEESTLNVHGKVELGDLKATGVKISLFDAPNSPKVQTFDEAAPQTGTQLNLGKLTGTGNSFYFATSDASVNIEMNGNAESETKPLIDSITGSGSVNDDVAGDLNELASMITVDDKTGAEVLKNTDLKLESGDVFGETTGTINEEGKLEDVKTSVNMNNVRIAEFAMRTPMQIARIESNDLRKRMGDIRSSEGVTGVWARYDGGRFSGGEFENKFNKVQVGADTALAAYGSRLGLSFSYTQGDADMSGMSGISADTDAYSLAAYGMWFGEAGQFADVIGRVGTVDTDLATRTYKTNYDQLMLSLSGEFGWRFDLTDTFYAEPSAELTYTRVDGETFKANGNTLGIDDYDSMVGRIGATAGLNCSQGRGGVYARFGVAHEFMGDGRFTAVNAAGTAADPIEVDGKDTWVEYAVGANFNITKQTYVWADLERTSGAEVDEDWRATIGVRHAF